MLHMLPHVCYFVIQVDISNYHYKFTRNLRDLGSKLPPKVDDHPSPNDVFLQVAKKSKMLHMLLSRNETYYE